MVDRKAEYHLPLQIVLIANHNEIRALQQVAGIEDSQVSGVLYAGTSLHGSKVYGLSGGIGPDGQPKNITLASLANADANSLGSYQFSKDGISDGSVLTAWWYVTNGEYRALAELGKLAKKRDEVGEQASLLVDRISKHFLAEKERLMGQPLDFAGYCQLETIAERMAYLRDLKDETKEITKLLKSTAKDDESIKQELVARSAYQQCRDLEMTMRIKDAEQAKAGYDQIADQYANTVYGQKAAQAALRMH